MMHREKCHEARGWNSPPGADYTFIMAASIYTGTSGYSYSDWVGPVYPAGTRNEDFLIEYQKIFSFVEINSSYYSIPRTASSRSMVDRSGTGFRFSIKTHRSLTHDHRGRLDDELREQIRHYIDGIAPLADGGRLIAILAQFPWSFHYTPENRRFLADALGFFHHCAADYLPGGTLQAEGSVYGGTGGSPLFVEFRNSEWSGESVLQGLAEYSAFPVYQDCPELDRLPGHLRGPTAVPAAEATSRSVSDLATAPASNTRPRSPSPAYIRFHGRNRDNWWTGTNVSRYDYLYSDDELDELLPAVRTIRDSASPFLIMAFNNHHRGQAVQNARSMQLLLNDTGS